MLLLQNKIYVNFPLAFFKDIGWMIGLVWWWQLATKNCYVQRVLYFFRGALQLVALWQFSFSYCQNKWRRKEDHVMQKAFILLTKIFFRMRNLCVQWAGKKSSRRRIGKTCVRKRYFLFCDLMCVLRLVKKVIGQGNKQSNSQVFFQCGCLIISVVVRGIIRKRICAQMIEYVYLLAFFSVFI